MTFEARNFTDNDRAYCDALSIKSPVSKGYPRCFLEDKVRNKFFMSFGGKGGFSANMLKQLWYHKVLGGENTQL